ncbi:hypothetical protein GJ744_000927 [Endocarpon pusillum]|uniref:Uncharacterized protein n=1 Tax=Endocarpon pusillum TaxID=364733 RepID=A0A8H7EAG7_9EURO|nr:hypothetical protein GJ744_000927 [Endocarpon pusillum]
MNAFLFQSADSSFVHQRRHRVHEPALAAQLLDLRTRHLRSMQDVKGRSAVVSAAKKSWAISISQPDPFKGRT